MYQLRDYQTDAVAATWGFLCSQPGNPVVVLPTGAGKSLVIADLCRQAVQQYAGQVIVLAHRKELLEQNAEKIRSLLPGMDVGIYSAGLRQRDTEPPIVVAGIQSCYRRATDFGCRNLAIIDEAHLVPFDGEGMYRSFLGDLRSANCRVRLVGLTATPYRLDCGPLCRPDGLFQKVAYSAPIRQLIDAGYLTNLTTKPAAGTVDTTGLRIRGGEFVPADTERLFGRGDVVESACREIVQATAGRRSVLVFCSGVQHAIHVAETIARLTGETCGVVTGETLPIERAATLADFRAGRLRFLCNVDVLTTGFDAPGIDCIAILRATMSPGLYAQICGRGFRIHPGKRDTLVLDFGGNIERHGPLDAIEFGRCHRTGAVAGEAPTKVCPNCEIEVHAAVAECADCGFRFPEREASHEDKAATAPILATPEEWIVESATYSEHRKKNAKPDDPSTLRVDYQCSMKEGSGNLAKTTISEWVCVEHDGYARRKAARWWSARCVLPMPATAAEAADLGRRGALAWPAEITTIKEGRWYRVTAAKLEAKPVEWLSEETVAAGGGWEEELPF